MGLLKVGLSCFVIFVAYQIYQVTQIEVPDCIPEKYQARWTHFQSAFGTYIANIFGYAAARVYRNLMIDINNSFGDAYNEVAVSHKKFDGIPVRYYESVKMKSKNRPALIYIHGGGYTYLTPRYTEKVMQKLVDRLQIVVISIDYRLAPDFAFPAQYEDCLKASKYVIDNARRLGLDPKKIAISGDSAGGHAAASVALTLKKKLAAQLLIYPAIQGINFRTPSFLRHKNTLILTQKATTRFWANLGGLVDVPGIVDIAANNMHSCEETKELLNQVINLEKMYNDVPRSWNVSDGINDFKEIENEPQPVVDNKLCRRVHELLINPRATLVLADPKDIRQLPKTYIMVSGYDVLKDDGIMYGYLLNKLGVDVTFKNWHASFHGFWPLQRQFKVARDAFEHYARFLEQVLALR